MKKLYFVGDAHFGAQDSVTEQIKEERFISFIKHVQIQNADLIICGDLFDFWFEYKNVIPRIHFRIIRHLADFIDSGHNIHYLAGNHDFWFGSFMQNEIGMIFHAHEYQFEVNGMKIYVTHGDGLLKNDHLYRFLKKILRNPICISLYRLLHPDLGIPFALHCSHQSRTVSDNQSNYSDADYRAFARQKILDGHDIVILGHTHWPALEKIHSGFYVNPGSWFKSFTYSVLQNDSQRIYQWDGNKGKEYTVSIPPGNNR